MTLAGPRPLGVPFGGLSRLSELSRLAYVNGARDSGPSDD
jgi:hypothetical protein